MKKLIGLTVMMIMAVELMAGCGGNNTESEETTSDQEPTESTSLEVESSEETRRADVTPGNFSGDATISETVMLDEGGVKITATGLNYGSYDAELEVTIENNSGKNLNFICGSLGYSCNSINGYMIDDGYLNCDIANGKKSNESISFSYDSLMLYGINEIADIEIGFSMKDDDYKYTYSSPCRVTTSIFDAHDYDKDYYIESITSTDTMSIYDYDVACFSQDTLYDENGIRLLSSALIQDGDDGDSLLLELENTTGSVIYTATSDIAINGLIIPGSTLSYDAINPGKRCIVDVDISYVLDSQHQSSYGINDIGSIALSLSQYDADGSEITDKTAIEITVPGAKNEYDASGTEVYSNNGLRIVAKSIIDGSSEYDDDIYVLLLAENKSGRTLTISDVYDSLSVNGYMTDYSCYSIEITDNSCAVLEIELWESSLEDNDITSASDIEDVEIQFEIESGRDLIDSPIVTISSNQ